jgi:hypothetical protein
MKPEIIQGLEALCEASVPLNYIQLLDSYPPALRVAFRADSGDDSEGVVSEVELFSSPTDVLEINREVRAIAILDPEGQEFRWPDQLLVIGETGDGDYYCVDLDGEHAGVLQFRHHAVEFEVVTDSLEEFVEMLIESFVTGSESGDDFDDSESDETE